MVYGKSVKVVSNLIDTNDYKSIENIIKRTGKPEPGSNVEEVLETLAEMIDQQKGGRPNVPKVAIIFVDEAFLLQLPSFEQDMQRLFNSGLKFVFVFLGESCGYGLAS